MRSLFQRKPLAPDALTPERRRAAMRSAVFGQCAGTVGSIVFANGLLLLYLKWLGMSDLAVIRSLAIFEVARAVLLLPAAHVADRHGIKRVGGAGLLMTIVGFAGITAAASFSRPASFVIVLTGITLFSAGYALFSAGWFALLSGFVPRETRGRFFGILRFSWQAVSIVFTAACTLVMPQNPGKGMFQALLLILTLGQADRLWHYRRLPEIAEPAAADADWKEAMGHVIRAPRYMPFSAYVFLLSLFTAGGPVLFATVEKEILGLGADGVVMLGTFLMVGYLAGFAAGGLAVDRLGTRVVFLLAHVGYGVSLIGLPLRGMFPPAALVPWLAAVNLGYGFFYAASTIAISTEMLALIPPQRKSLATSLCTTLAALGNALSSWLAAAAISAGMLASTWTLRGAAVSAYDTILVVYGVMVMLLVVTLGLVPSVVGKAEEVPK